VVYPMATHKSRRCCCSIFLIFAVCVTHCRGFQTSASSHRKKTFLHITRFHYDSNSNSNSTNLNAYGGNDLPYLRIRPEFMSIPSSIPNNSALSDPTDNHSSSPETDTTPPATETGPFPIMPSQTFFNLANLQFELLSNSIQFKDQPKKRK